VVSVLHSEKILKVASTAFEVVGENKPILPTPQSIVLPPRLSLEDIKLLSQLSLDGLRSLANAMGESKSVIFQMICLAGDCLPNWKTTANQTGCPTPAKQYSAGR